MREYIPGDQITLKVTFIHAMHIKHMAATLVHAEEEPTNWPVITLEPRNWEWQVQTGGRLRSTVVFTSTDRVPASVQPGGVYKLNSLWATTYGDRDIDLLESVGRFDVRCRVRSGEPQDPPSVVDVAFE